MPFTTATPYSEVAILNRLIRPERNDLSVTAARAILKIDFEQSDRDRMRELSRKAREGTLKPEEQEEINCYERLGHLLALLHSKARLSLKKHTAGQ
jgi:hypothetical protein